MAESRNVGVSCLFVLYTFVSAFAQTTTSETRAPEPPQAAPRTNSTKDVPPVAEEISPHATAAEQAQLAQRFLDERLAVWRQRLKLQDWRISAVLTRRSDLAPKTLGGIRWDKTKKTAAIWVLDPADYRLPIREMLDDMELTIIHELIHLGHTCSRGSRWRQLLRRRTRGQRNRRSDVGARSQKTVAPPSERGSLTKRAVAPILMCGSGLISNGWIIFRRLQTPGIPANPLITRCPRAFSLLHGRRDAGSILHLTLAGQAHFGRLAPGEGEQGARQYEGR